MITNAQKTNPVIADVIVDGVDAADYPDFADAFIVSCTLDGVPATDEQIDELDGSLVYDEIYNSIL